MRIPQMSAARTMEWSHAPPDHEGYWLTGVYRRGKFHSDVCDVRSERGKFQWSFIDGLTWNPVDKYPKYWWCPVIAPTDPAPPVRKGVNARQLSLNDDGVKWILDVRKEVTKAFPKITVDEIVRIFRYDSAEMDILHKAFYAGKTPQQAFAKIRRRACVPRRTSKAKRP